MKKGKLQSFLIKVWSAVILSVFLSIPVLQAFHHHHQEQHLTDGKTSFTSDLTCHCCDYFINKQSKYIHYTSQQEYFSIHRTSVTLLPTNQQDILFPLLLFQTNKGPPAFMQLIPVSTIYIIS